MELHREAILFLRLSSTYHNWKLFLLFFRLTLIGVAYFTCPWSLKLYTYNLFQKQTYLFIIFGL